jgi:hypothetical protein
MLARMIEGADEFCKPPSTIHHPRSTAGNPKSDGNDS